MREADVRANFQADQTEENCASEEKDGKYKDQVVKRTGVKLNG